MTYTTGSSLLRWAARVSSLVSIGFVLLFVIGEVLNGEGRGPNTVEWVALALFPFGVVVGLVIGWLRERIGGTVAIGSLIAFYLWFRIVSGVFPRGPYFFLVTLPAILFIIGSLLSREHKRVGLS